MQPGSVEPAALSSTGWSSHTEMSGPESAIGGLSTSTTTSAVDSHGAPTQRTSSVYVVVAAGTTLQVGTPDQGQIGVVPSRRGKGIGSGLLDALLDRARKDGFGGISLSVEKTNPAVHLYESRGFRQVAGDGDVLMVAELQRE